MSENGPLPARITRAGEGIDGTVWNVLGHTYVFKANCDSAFSFETYDPPGTFVPPHIHPTQDEFIYVLEGTFDLYLDGEWLQAKAGDLVCMPMGKPHAYYKPHRRAEPRDLLGQPGAQAQGAVRPAPRPHRPGGGRAPFRRLRVDFLPPGSVPAREPGSRSLRRDARGTQHQRPAASPGSPLRPARASTLGCPSYRDGARPRGPAGTRRRLSGSIGPRVVRRPLRGQGTRRDGMPARRRALAWVAPPSREIATCLMLSSPPAVAARSTCTWTRSIDATCCAHDSPG